MLKYGIGSNYYIPNNLNGNPAGTKTSHHHHYHQKFPGGATLVSHPAVSSISMLDFDADLTSNYSQLSQSGFKSSGAQTRKQRSVSAYSGSSPTKCKSIKLGTSAMPKATTVKKKDMNPSSATQTQLVLSNQHFNSKGMLLFGNIRV